jgi:hypothetical protein
MAYYIKSVNTERDHLLLGEGWAMGFSKPKIKGVTVSAAVSPTAGVSASIAAEFDRSGADPNTGAGRVFPFIEAARERLTDSDPDEQLKGLRTLDRIAKEFPESLTGVVDALCRYLREPFDLKPLKLPEDQRDPQWKSREKVRYEAQEILCRHLRTEDTRDKARRTIDINLKQGFAKVACSV